MISTDPGPRLGRESLRNDGSRCKPVRDENPCAAWISAVSSTWHEPLMLTTDQEVGDSSSSGRAAETPALRGFLLSPAQFESPCVFVGQRLGSEVSSPDVIESFDEYVDVGGEEVELDGLGTGVGCSEQTSAMSPWASAADSRPDQQLRRNKAHLAECSVSARPGSVLRPPGRHAAWFAQPSFLLRCDSDPIDSSRTTTAPRSRVGSVLALPSPWHRPIVFTPARDRSAGPSEAPLEPAMLGQAHRRGEPE